MTREALRALYDVAVNRGAEGMDPERAMAYRHACYLTWQRLDVPALVQSFLEGRRSEADVLEIVLPFVREALAAAAPTSPTHPARPRVM